MLREAGGRQAQAGFLRPVRPDTDEASRRLVSGFLQAVSGRNRGVRMNPNQPANQASVPPET